MKKILLLALSSFCFAAMPLKKKKIVFFGDSITQMGVNDGGYIDLMRKNLATNGKANSFELIGAGIGGNKVYDLYLRLEEDVLAHKPDRVFIYVGINDVWHKTSGTGTDIEKFEKFYTAIIKKLQAAKSKIVLCTPTVIGEKKNNANPQDADLNAYAAVIRRLATSHKCQLADLRSAFASYEQTNNTDNKDAGLLTTDRVHLTDAGNKLVADQLLSFL